MEVIIQESFVLDLFLSYINRLGNQPQLIDVVVRRLSLTEISFKYTVIKIVLPKLRVCEKGIFLVIELYSVRCIVSLGILVVFLLVHKKEDKCLLQSSLIDNVELFFFC